MAETKQYLIEYTVKLRGSIVVEAESAAAARAQWENSPTYTDDSTSELVDWEFLGAKEDR